MNDVISSIKLIGIPNMIEPATSLEVDRAIELFPVAKLNKIALLFLESLKFGDHSTLEAHLSCYRSKHMKTLALTSLVSDLFEEEHIQYAIFKTLKPFPYTPSDIDVLLCSTDELSNASQILEKKGLRSIEKDFFGLTMFSGEYGLNVDLTTEVAVSGLIYLDKNLLFNHVSQVKVNGFKVQTLSPHADLVTTAAHCMYKEQMYTLSDYYTFALSSKHYEEALKLAEKAHAKFALETALKLTYIITISAFGSGNTLVERLKNSINTFDLNTIIQTRKLLDLPIKYPSYVLLKGLSQKILEDPVSRNSLPKVIKSTIQPKFFSKLLEHITRKAY